VSLTEENQYVADRRDKKRVCIPCRRAASARSRRDYGPRDRYHEKLKTFGLTMEDYERLLTEQGGVCKLCGKPEGGTRAKRLAVDHDHDTGRIRGLLCRRCNTTLSWVEKLGLAQFVAYLREA
jgi:hypothetical protein